MRSINSILALFYRELKITYRNFSDILSILMLFFGKDQKLSSFLGISQKYGIFTVMETYGIEAFRTTTDGFSGKLKTHHSPVFS